MEEETGNTKKGKCQGELAPPDVDIYPKARLIKTMQDQHMNQQMEYSWKPRNRPKYI